MSLLILLFVICCRFQYHFFPFSLHDALPISNARRAEHGRERAVPEGGERRPVAARADPHHPPLSGPGRRAHPDRKSTRLNSSYLVISYAVFCLKKKTNKSRTTRTTKTRTRTP